MSNYYIAYGSNIDTCQMSRRCSTAIPIGKGFLKGYQLNFRGEESGRSYLTVDEKDGYKAPFVLYKVSDEDIKSLDRYEGCPNSYYKELQVVLYYDFVS